MRTHKILNTRIPPGGFGRPLTSSERKLLRAEINQPVSDRAIVVQAGADYRGYLYHPVRGGGYSGGTVAVELRDGKWG